MSDRRSWWRPVVVSENPSVRISLLEILRRRIPLLEEAILSECQDAQTILDVVQAGAANVCLIDVSGSEDRALTLIRSLAAQDLTVVALHTGNDSGLILRCVRCGAHEFLNGPFDADSVWQTLDELATRRLKEGLKLRRSVYAVFPSKPSLGSTTVATGLALRAQGEGCSSVLLADLDPLYGSIGFHLKIKSAYTFLNAFSNWAKMDQEFWNKLVVKHAGLDVLMAPEASGSCDFEAPNASDFLHIVRKSYSHAFLDCPGLITPWYTQLAVAADEVILVTSNELTALHAAKQSLRILEVAGVDAARIKVLVNRYDPGKGLPSDAIEMALRTKVFHTLPNDYDAVQKAIFEGRPIGSSSQLGKGLDELWTRLMNRIAIPKTAHSWSSIFSLMKRR